MQIFIKAALMSFYTQKTISGFLWDFIAAESYHLNQAIHKFFNIRIPEKGITS